MSLTFDYENVAKVCHEANRAYCETIGDTSQLPWDIAPEWQRVSAFKGVEFHMLNENTTPADSHNSWLKEKREQGWQYGEIKDVEKKLHPCFVPYEELPKNQQVKDYIFKGIVDAYKNALFTKEPLKELSFGQQLVGLTFNPSGREDVNKAKQLSADLIDLVADNHNKIAGEGNPISWARSVLRTAAVNAIITAQMAVVKILTWND